MDISVLQSVLGANDLIAQENRKEFDSHGCFVVNLMSAPGSGKTLILERTLRALDGRIRAGVIEGDVQGTLDADRLAPLGAPVVQINTDPHFGGACHLDARMVRNALPALKMEGLDFVFIENVGNLVCPAEYRVGEDRKVMVLSVTEGEEKPLKYPLMFRVSHLLLLNKVDLLDRLDVSVDRLLANVARVNPTLPVIQVSAKDGRGCEEWIKWLLAEKARKAAVTGERREGMGCPARTEVRSTEADRGWKDPASASFWEQRGVSRRQFLAFCGAMAATLALPERYVGRIAEALENVRRPSLVWLEFQDCCGNTESFLRASKPTVAEIALDILSVNYHETIMAPAGKAAEKSLMDTVKNEKGKYLVVVEGSIPLKDGGVYCTIGGRTALDIAREVCGNALATIAVGACAWDGGWPAASPNPTGAVGVREAVPGIKLINLPGCPMNVQNLTATVVHFLTFGGLPASDPQGRPLFAYGERIHDHCERRGHYDAGHFVEEWGDEGHRRGWCLYKMGCKGPQTYKNCPIIRWNDGVNWPVGAGHGCIGCAAPNFWDTMSPFYRRLPQVPGFGVETTADQIGVGLTIATGAAFAAHGILNIIRKKARGTQERTGEEG